MATDFRTTKMKQNAPGLTFVTPKGLPAKYNKVTGGLEIADKVIKTAVELDKQRVIGEAEDIASQSAEEYLDTSPSNTNFLLGEQQRIQTDLTLDPTNEEAPMWKESLREITDKLSNAYNQGGMTAYEFERRSNAKIMDLINSNPVYRDEIVSETTKVYNAMGITDVLAADANLRKTQADAFKAEDDAYNKIILESNQNPFNMSFEDKKLEVSRIQANAQKMGELESLVKTDELLDENGKILFENKLNNFTYRGRGNQLYKGYNAVTEQTFNGISTETLEIINDPLKNPQEKLYEANQVLRDARTYLNYVGRNFSKGNKDKVTRWYDEQIKQVDILQAMFEKDFLGNNTKEYLQNLNDSASLTNKINLREGGTNIEAIELAHQMRSIITKEQQVNPDFNPSTEQIDVINKGISAIESNSGGKLRPSQSDEGLIAFYAQRGASKLRQLDSTLSKAIEQNLPLDETVIGFINNVFTTSENLGLQQGDSNRVKYDDKVFTAINSMSDNSISYLVKTESDFRDSFNNELNYYKDRVHDTVLSIKQGQNIPADTKVEVEYFSGLGIFNVSGNSQLNNEMQRVNKYIQTKAKFLGVNPNTIAKETLKKDFSMFTFEGRPPSKKITKEEADKNPDSVTEYDIVVMPDGTEMKGPKYVD